MTLKQALVLATLAVTSTSIAHGRPSEVDRGVARPGGSTAQAPLDGRPAPQPQVGANDPEIRPRSVFGKPAVVKMPQNPTGRLIVKFRDDVQARVAQGGRVVSRAQHDLAESERIVALAGATFRPAFSLSEEKLRAIESRALLNSNRMQPDLAGMMYVVPPQGVGAAGLQQLANALNGRPEIEFVEIEPDMFTTGGGGGGGPGACCIPQGEDLGTVVCQEFDEDLCNQAGGRYLGEGAPCPVACDLYGACCIPGGTNDCETLTEIECTSIPGAVFRGVGSNCATTEAVCDDPDCGVNGTGDCFECHDPIDFPASEGLFCEDEECCTAVCDIDPFCCDENAVVPGRGVPHWDELCVALAQQLCLGAPEDICLSPLSGGCYESHPGPGCNLDGCCFSVCSVEPFCCSVEWDQICVELAIENCTDPSGGTTPGFQEGQGYLFGPGYVGQHGAVPPSIAPGIEISPCSLLPLAGWGGQGWDLHGLWLLGQQVQDLVIESGGQPVSNRARGKGIKVGVIEFSAFADWNDPSRTHEDLRGKVIAEPNQTQIIIPGSERQSGHHGTACLGIIGAKDDGRPGHGPVAMTDANERGCVGIAPDAELYFFPTVSIEESGRLLNAVLNACDIFGPGDVLSFSIGPGGGGTIASDPATWNVLRLAADLGITCCIAAGNSCSNVDGAGQFECEESDVVIVGAIFPGSGPGNDFCRLGFSNFCRACDGPCTIHVAAWGAGVLTLGYGDLFLGPAACTDGNGSPVDCNAIGHHVRSYTNTFGGTSAATPMIAGLVANLQGLAKMQHGIPLAPFQIRNILTNAATEGGPQCGTLDPPGAPPGQECLGDFDPEAEANRVIGFPPAILAAEFTLAHQFFDSTTLTDDIVLIRGNLVVGNINSVRGVDNNYFVATSLYTPRNHQPPFEGPPGRVTYLGDGQVVDVMVRAHADRKNVHSMQVDTVVAPPGPTSFMFVELYNWSTQSWEFINFQVLQGPEGGAGIVGNHLATSAQRFIKPGGSREVLIRAYILAPGNVSPDGTSTGGGFTARFDLINLTVFGGFGQPGSP